MGDEGGHGGGGGGTKKKYRPGTIELDSAECALLVNYDCEILEEGPDGERRVLEKQAGVKKIKARPPSDPPPFPPPPHRS